MTLLDKLRARFEWLEREDLRVGLLYLNAGQIAELGEHRQDFDVCATRQLREAGIRGALWGATVFESDLVPDNHVCIVQDGLDVKLVDGAACVRLV